MLTLTIQADSAEELRAHLNGLVAKPPQAVAQPTLVPVVAEQEVSATIPAPAAVVQEAAPAAAPARGKRGRKSQPAAAVVQEVLPSEPAKQETAGEQQPQDAAPNYDDVVNALKQVNEKLLMGKVREILADFGVQQVKAIKPEQFAAVIAAANKALAA